MQMLPTVTFGRVEVYGEDECDTAKDLPRIEGEARRLGLLNKKGELTTEAIQEVLNQLVLAQVLSQRDNLEKLDKEAFYLGKFPPASGRTSTY